MKIVNSELVSLQSSQARHTWQAMVTNWRQFRFTSGWENPT